MSAEEELRALIDRMKAEQVDRAVVEALESEPDEIDVKDYVEAPEPKAAEQIVAQIALLRVQKAAIDKAEKQLVAAAKVITGTHEGLRIGHTKLAKITRTQVTRINTEIVRELFPIESYPQLYNVSDEERFLVDTAFKQDVLTANSTEKELDA